MSSYHFLGEYINKHEQSVGGNMDAKAIVVVSQTKIRNRLLKSGQKAIFVIKLQNIS